MSVRKAAFSERKMSYMTNLVKLVCWIHHLPNQPLLVKELARQCMACALSLKCNLQTSSCQQCTRLYQKLRRSVIARITIGIARLPFVRHTVEGSMEHFTIPNRSKLFLQINLD